MKQIEKILTSPATWYLGGAILLTVILRQWGILRTGPTKEEKQVKEIKFDDQLWGTRIWQEYPEKSLTDKQADNLAQHIKQSFSWIDDDEARIYGAFRSIRYRVNVSQIAFRSEERRVGK